MSTGLEQLLRLLHSARVKFVLIGGLSAIAHGAEPVLPAPVPQALVSLVEGRE